MSNVGVPPIFMALAIAMSASICASADLFARHVCKARNDRVQLGTLIDGQIAMSGSAAGDPQPRCYVVAFSKDRVQWTPFSRRAVAARPDDLGHFTIRGLPPGDYHISAFDGDEPINWSASAFLAALKPQAEVMLVRGQIQSAVLTCR